MRRAVPFVVAALLATGILFLLYRQFTPDGAPLETDLRPEAVPACGPAWRPEPPANPSKEYNEVHGLSATGADDVWAVGTFGTEQFALTLIEHFDGERWNHVESPSISDYSNHLYGVVASATGDVWAVGASHRGTDIWRTLVLRRESGVAPSGGWSVVPSPNTGPISSLNAAAALPSGEVWAVGESSRGTKGSGSQTLIERWDGKGWSIIPSPNASPDNTLNAVAAISANDIWAGGSYTDRSGTLAKPLTLHWDGREWKSIDNPGTGTIFGLSVLPSGEVWAVGNNGPQTMTMRLKGGSWEGVPSPNVGSGSNSLNSVSALSSGEVWAVGSRAAGNSGNGDRTLAMRWDGTRWTVTPSPSMSDLPNTFYAVAAVSPGHVWAAGSYITDNIGTNLALLQRYFDPCAAAR